MTDTFVRRVSYGVITLLLVVAAAFLLLGHFADALNYAFIAALAWANLTLATSNQRLRSQLRSANEQLRIAHLKGGHL